MTRVYSRIATLAHFWHTYVVRQIVQNKCHFLISIDEKGLLVCTVQCACLHTHLSNPKMYFCAINFSPICLSYSFSVYLLILCRYMWISNTMSAAVARRWVGLFTVIKIYSIHSFTLVEHDAFAELNSNRYDNRVLFLLTKYIAQFFFP